MSSTRLLIIQSIFILVQSFCSGELCNLEPDSTCGIQTTLEAKWEKEMYLKAPYTMEQEWPYLKDLDFADEHIVSDPSTAMKLFDKILEKVFSPRAIYAQIRCRQLEFIGKSREYQVSSEGQKELETIADDFIKLSRNPEIVDGIWKSVINQGNEHCQRNNLYFKSVDLLSYILTNQTERAFKLLNTEYFYKILSEDYFVLSRFDDAISTLKNASERFPENPYFKFLLGLTLKKSGKKREGNRIFREEIDSNIPAYVMNENVEYLRLKMRAIGMERSEFDSLDKEASKLHIFPSSIQRPYEYFEDLTSRPIWSDEDSDDDDVTTYSEELRKIERDWKVILEEAETVMQNMTEDWITASESEVAGNWSEFHLFSFGKRRHHSCHRMPRTCRLFSDFTTSSRFPKGTVKVSVLQPGTKVLPRTGPTNANLRCHLGLKIPSNCGLKIAKGQIQTVWKEGRILVFEPSYEHELWNLDRKEPLILFSFDVPHPDLVQKDDAFNARAKMYFMF